MDNNYNFVTSYPQKLSSKQQKILLDKYLKTKNKKAKEQIATELCSSFICLIKVLLFKHKLLDYDNISIIYIKLYNSLEKYDLSKKATIYTYFYHIVTNQIYDILRSKKRNRIDYIDNDLLRSTIDKNLSYRGINIDNIFDGLTKEEEKVLRYYYFNDVKPNLKESYINLLHKVAIVKVKNMIKNY